jgi:hypothetical protein
MDSADFGALGFWIFIASIAIAGMWSSSRREAEKHETVRRIVEKTGVVDEAKLKELFSRAEAPQSPPGGGYRALRITGTIIMFIAAVPAIFGTLALIVRTMGLLSESKLPPPDFVVGTLMISACILVVGLGVFFSSRFAEPPAGARNEFPTR